MSLRRLVSISTLSVLLFAVAQSTAQSSKVKPAPRDVPPVVNPTISGSALAAARGTVAKVEKDSLTIKPRGADGRFEKELTLLVTGTSRVTQLSLQNRSGKIVAVQQDAQLKNLNPGDAVAVIYAESPDGLILLSAVVQPAPSK
jgi:hypothetical protein